MTMQEKIKAKREMCEIIDEIIDRILSWRKQSALEKDYKDEETGEWLSRPKTEEEISDWDRAKLNAVETIENALMKLI